MNPPQVALLPGDLRRGVLGRITLEVYWILALTALLALACLPGVLIALLVEPGRPSVLILALAAVPLGPALGAGVFAWQVRTRREDPSPWRCFARGYRLSALDVLKVWTPTVAVLALLGTGVLAVRVGVVPTAYLGVLAVLAIGVLLTGVQALIIATFFTFRVRDTVRLALFHTFRLPRVSLAVAALGVCLGGAVYLTGDWVAALAGGLFARILGHYERGLLSRIRTEFTTAT